MRVPAVVLVLIALAAALLFYLQDPPVPAGPGRKPAEEPGASDPPPTPAPPEKEDRKPPPPTMTVKILGRVLEDGTDRPVEGVTVRAWGREGVVRTDAEGRFRYTCHTEAALLFLEGAFHQPRRFKITGLVDGESREVEYRLPRGGRIRGRVLDHEGKPVAGAWVDYGWNLVAGAHVGDSWGAKPRYVSGEDGTFDLTGVPPGLVQVFAAIPKRCSGVAGDRPFAVSAGKETAGVEVRLLPPCALTLRIATDDGKDPGYVSCWLTEDHDEPWHPSSRKWSIGSKWLSGRAEGFEIGGMIRREYGILVTAKGYVPVTLEASEVLPEVTEAHREVKITLERGAAITGWVRDASGAPVPKAALRAELEGKEQAWDPHRGRATAGDDGRFTISGLKDGVYTVIVRNRNRKEIIRQAGIAAGTKDLVLTAGKVGGTVTGTLLDAKGRPIRFANILAFRDRGEEPIGRDRDGVVWGRGKEGKYAFDLDPGTWWLLPPGGPAVRVDVHPGPVSGPDLVVAKDRTVTGRIRAGKRSLSNALVVIAPEPLSDDTPHHFREDCGFCVTAWTDGEGRYRATGLGAGPVTVRAYHADFLPRRIDLVLRDGQPAGDVELAEGAWVDVEPVGPYGGSFEVQLRPEYPPAGWSTSPDARFFFRALRRAHPNWPESNVWKKVDAGASFGFGPYRPGEYTMTLEARFGISGTSRTVIVRKRGSVKLDRPGRTPLRIVFTREEIESKIKGR